MRKYYLDNIRWATVVLVVIYHTLFMFNGVSTELVIGPFSPVQYQDAFLYLIYPWFMILLFTVSGAAAKYALEKKTPKEFIKARTEKLLVPSTLGLLVFHWIGGYINMNIVGSFGEVKTNVPGAFLWPILSVSGTGPLWFIQMLWIFSVLLMLIRKIIPEKVSVLTEKCNTAVLLAAAVPLWLCAQIMNTPVITVYRFGIYGLAFFLGYFIFSEDKVTERLSRHWLPLSAAAAVTGAAYCIYYFGRDYVSEPVVGSPFSVFYGWIAVLAVFALMKRFGDRETKFTAWMGRHSFGLYVFHYMPMSAAALWICSRYSLPAFPSYIITGLAAFAGGWGLNAIISRIPVIRWCLLGTRKKVKKDVQRQPNTAPQDQ